ncbi:integrase core domain-containing protein, partial [Phocaeicola plebeius]
EAVSKSVAMYNNARPHRALGMKTPMEIFSGRRGNPLMEYRYN